MITLACKTEVWVSRSFVFIIAFVTALDSAATLAQEGIPADPAAESELPTDNEVFAAPVVVDGEELFDICGSTALPASKRAEKVQERIIAIAESSEDMSVTARVLDNEFGKEIEIDGRMATVTTMADADFEQIELDVLAGLHAEAIE